MPKTLSTKMLTETVFKKLPSDENIASSFTKACECLRMKQYEKHMQDTVIYEMTDGMRTSTPHDGDVTYFDGGIFCLRFINILRALGMPACYVNVIEEKHKHRVNYRHIFDGLRKLYSVFDEYAEEYNIRLRFLGNLDERLEPPGQSGDFAGDLRELEKNTKSNKTFCAYFLMNYSLDWAMKNESIFADVHNIDVTIRHTKLQFPTGMMLPPSKSDFTSLVYVQQGSASSTWSDQQLVDLVALALKSKILNVGTQYLKWYKVGERERVRFQREEDLFFMHRRLFVDRLVSDILYEKVDDKSIRMGYPPKIKRVILAGAAGPEIYEF